MRNKDLEIYESKRIDLIKTFYVTAERAYDHVPVVYFEIVLHGTDTVIGDLDLRLLMNDYMYYYGHIGYEIHQQYRGNSYALEACQMIKVIAKDIYGLDELIITCNPDNTASYKTLERLGCQCVGIEDVPKTHELYWKGEKKKAIFRLAL